MMVSFVKAAQFVSQSLQQCAHKQSSNIMPSGVLKGLACCKGINQNHVMGHILYRNEYYKKFHVHSEIIFLVSFKITRKRHDFNQLIHQLLIHAPDPRQFSE